MFLKLNWRKVIEHPICTLNTLKENDTVYIGAIVTQPDGRKVKVVYYSIPDKLRATRERANGEWGSSKYYSADRDGWLRAIQHNLPKKYRAQ